MQYRGSIIKFTDKEVIPGIHDGMCGFDWHARARILSLRFLQGEGDSLNNCLHIFVYILMCFQVWVCGGQLLEGRTVIAKLKRHAKKYLYNLLHYVQC